METNVKGKENVVQAVQQDDEMEIDLLELFLYFKSKLLFIIIGFLVGAIVAGLITVYLITPKYTASSKLYMVSASSDSIVDLTDLNIGTSLSSDYEELLKVRPIFEEVIKKEKLPYEYEELLDMVTISTVADTRILEVSVESTDPDEAKRIANRIATLAVTEIPRLMGTSKPNIAEKAILPEEQSSPSLFKNVMIGALGCMVLVLGVLTFRFMMDDTLCTAEDVEKAFGIMPLTSIPEGSIKSISDDKEKEINKQKKKNRKRRK